MFVFILCNLIILSKFILLETRQTETNKISTLRKTVEMTIFHHVRNEKMVTSTALEIKVTV